MLNKIKAKLLTPLILYLLVDLIAKGLQFFLLPSASYILTIESYGKLTLILALLTALAPIVSLSSEAAYSVFFNQVKENEKVKLFVACLLVSLSGFALFSSLVLILSLFNDQLIFKIISLRQDVLLICIVVFFEFIITVSLLTNRLTFQKFKYFIAYLSYVGTKFLVGISSIYIFESPNDYLVSILINNIVFAGIFVSFTFGLKNIATQLKLFPRDYYKTVFNYSIIILPVTLFSVVNSLVDKAFISNFLSISDLANYTSVFLLAGALQIIIMALNKSYMPKLLKLYSLEGYRALNSVRKDTIRFLLIVSLCFVASIFLSPILFALLFDDGIKFYPQVFIVLSLAFSFNSIYILYTNVLSLEAKTAKFKMFGFLIALCINIPLSYGLTLNFGLFGAAISTLLSTLIAASVLSLFVSKVILRFYLLKIYLAFVTFMSLIAFSTIYFELYSYTQLNNLIN